MKRLLSPFLITGLFGIAHGQQESSFEKKMYNIYKQSYSEEVSDEKWAGYISGVSNRAYVVRPGDTLWDLSVVFFGDGLFWSKIWSYNEQLTNPHLLSVGQRVHFFTGSVEQAPGISVEPVGDDLTPPPMDGDSPPLAEGGDPGLPSQTPSNLPEGFKEVVTEVSKGPEAPEVTEGVKGESPVGEETLETIGQEAPKPQPIVKQVESRSQLYPGAPAIPPPQTLVRPVLKILPNTFEEFDAYDKSQYDEKGISFDLRPPVRVNPLFVANKFLFGRSFLNYPNVGRVIESEDKMKLVGVNQQVYIKANQNLDIGERLTIMGLDYPFDRNGVIGDVVQYQGTIEITEKIRDKIYRGTVIKSIDGIKGSPFLSRENIPTFTDDYVGRPNEVKLQIIGGGNDNVTRFYGQSDVIFIHGGTDRGVRVGDILGVYKRRDIRYKDTTVDRSPVPIGHAKVFRVEPHVASAFIINSTDAIVPGDETGPPTMVEAVTTVSEKEDLNSIETGLDFQTDSQPEEDATLDEDTDFEKELDVEIE